jgi:hypothetical protein
MFVLLKLLYLLTFTLTSPCPQLQLPHIADPTATPTANENIAAPATYPGG